ncbi:MAG: isochorismatase family protein [Pseudomonadota bacterium]
MTDSVYARQNFGNKVGIGKRPAMVLVDFIEAFVDENQFGGHNIRAASENSARLLAAFRKHGFPVAHARIAFADDGSDVNVFCKKVPGLAKLTESSPATRFVEALTPQAGELVVTKVTASAFFNTRLADWLRLFGVDTLVVAGCTTSGCVRATVIDAVQHNFQCIVPEDCSGDRAQGPHEANLFDMQQKYADVISLDVLLGELGGGKQG